VRMITGLGERHNPAGGLLSAAMAIAWLITTGCGGDRPEVARELPAARSRGAAACPLVATDTGLAEFLALADRVAGGEAVPVEEMGAVAGRPVWDRWRRSYEPETLPAAAVGRMLFIALVGRDELPSRLQDKTIRADLVRSYEIALARRAEITAFVEGFIAEDVGCRVREQLAGWLPAADLPDTVRIDFLVAHPEIRYYEDHLHVDAGLAWAAGRDQLVRFLASTLYRDQAAIAGRQPASAHGPDIVLETLRLVYNEAVPVYLDDLPHLAFDPRHPLLAKAAPDVEDLGGQAARTLRAFDAGLTAVRGRPAPTDGDWLALYRIFVGAQSWRASGWFMARVIAGHLGEPRLQAAARTVPEFLAAYHEACAAAPGNRDAAPGSLAAHLASPPAFTPENAAWLDRELRRLFP